MKTFIKVKGNGPLYVSYLSWVFIWNDIIMVPNSGLIFVHMSILLNLLENQKPLLLNFNYN